MARVTIAGTDAIAKVFVGDAYQRAEVEFNAMNDFNLGGVPVAQTIELRPGRCEDCGDLARALLMRPLSGQSLEHAYSMSVAPISLSDEIANVLVRQFGLGTRTAPTDYVVERARRLMSNYGGTLQTLGVDPLALARFAKSAASVPPPLKLHPMTFDWRRRHIFVATGVVTGVLDLEYLDWGDPLLEMSNLAHDFRLANRVDFAGIAARTIAQVGRKFNLSQNLAASDWYMARQALSHAAIRSLAGDASESMLSQELELAHMYMWRLENERHQPAEGAIA